MATVSIAGRAKAGARVTVDARCKPAACKATATAADGTGAFAVKVRAEADPGGQTSFVDVRAQDQSSTVLVTLAGPRNAGKPARPQPAAEPVAPPDDDEDDDLDEPAPEPQPLPEENRDTQPTTSSLPRRLHVVGDSLAVGTRAPLKANLPGWRVTTDAAEDRTLAAGMARPLPGGPRPSVIAYSLFTNDGPRGTAALESAVRESLTRVPAGGCVIWATIVRPPVGGAGYANANTLLRSLAASSGGRMIVAEWSRAISAQPGWLADDGVHGTSAGYVGRASLYADAARECVS